MTIIQINGIIGSNEAINALSIAGQIQKAGDEITFIVDSDGGEVDEGFLIAQMIENCGKKTTAIAKRVVSIANVIFLACDTRICEPSSSFMIHPPFFSGNILADEKTLIELTTQIKSASKRILDYYEKRTGTPKSVIEPLFTADRWFGQSEAMNLNFANFLKINNNLMSKEKANALTNILNKFFASETPEALETPETTSNETVSREEFDALKTEIAALSEAIAALKMATEDVTADTIANAIMQKFSTSGAEKLPTVKNSFKTDDKKVAVDEVAPVDFSRLNR